MPGSGSISDGGRPVIDAPRRLADPLMSKSFNKSLRCSFHQELCLDLNHLNPCLLISLNQVFSVFCVIVSSRFHFPHPQSASLWVFLLSTQHPLPPVHSSQLARAAVNLPPSRSATKPGAGTQASIMGYHDIELLRAKLAFICRDECPPAVRVQAHQKFPDALKLPWIAQTTADGAAAASTSSSASNIGVDSSSSTPASDAAPPPPAPPSTIDGKLRRKAEVDAVTAYNAEMTTQDVIHGRQRTLETLESRGIDESICNGTNAAPLVISKSIKVRLFHNCILVGFTLTPKSVPMIVTQAAASRNTAR